MKSDEDINLDHDDDFFFGIIGFGIIAFILVILSY